MGCAHRTAGFLLALLVSLTAAGCQLAGPRIIEAGRVRYNDVIQRTGNEELLLNLVRLRYSDTPFFLQVASVSTAFEFRSTSSLGIALSPTSYAVGSGVDLAEEPTITYTPLQGEEFVTSLLTPVGLENVELLSHSGWAFDRVLRVCVQEMNDVPNAPSATGPTPAAPPQYEAFLRAATLLRELQEAGQLSIRRTAQGGGPALRLVLEPEAAGSPTHRELASLLGLDPGLAAYELATDDGTRRPDRIAVMTRSLMAAFFYVSQGVEVPPEDEAAGRVRVTRTPAGERFDWTSVTGDLFRVRHAADPPEDASVRTHYRDRWFYLADADLGSEATFALLMQLFSLQSGSTSGGGPVLTLPVSR